jgi:hypothetical protein
VLVHMCARVLAVAGAAGAYAGGCGCARVQHGLMKGNHLQAGYPAAGDIKAR